MLNLLLNIWLIMINIIKYMKLLDFFFLPELEFSILENKQTNK